MSAFPAIGGKPLGVAIGPGGFPVVERTTSQILSLYFSTKCHHVLLEGTRGGGKSEVQIVAFLQHVGKGYGRHWRGIIFDREYKHLDDLVSKSQKLIPRLFPDARFLASKGDYKWVFPEGEELLFRVIKKAADYENYHGHEYPFIGWNELTKWPTSELYDALMSCNRSSFLPEEHSPIGEDGVMRLLPEIPLLVFSTTNPHGPGHNWVQARFIDVAKPGRVVRTTINVFNPRTQQREDVTRSQVRFFSSYKENRYLSPVYVAELEGITDPNKRKAWLLGDWNITAGGAYDDLWGDHLIKPRFKGPRGWYVNRSFDWGSTRPFSVGWWAEANGENVVMPDGSTWCPPRGTLVRIAEWYGAEQIGTNRGLKLSAKAVAEGIRQREADMVAAGWIATKPAPGPADNSIGNVIDTGEESIRTKMQDAGIEWTESDKSAGSRKVGFQLVRDRLEASKTGESPGMYFCQNCAASITLLKTLPRDETDLDDVDTEAEDHVHDDTRYRVLSGTGRTARSLNVGFAI